MKLGLTNTKQVSKIVARSDFSICSNELYIHSIMKKVVIIHEY